jgi:hypothetical protein
MWSDPRDPLPRQTFRSFLATAGDPSPNPGGPRGRGGADGIQLLREPGRGMVSRPHPRPFPHKQRGEGGATHLPERDRILPLSSRSLRGEGAGGAGRGVGDRGRSSMPVVAPANSPRSARNERGGGRGRGTPRTAGCCSVLEGSRQGTTTKGPPRIGGPFAIHSAPRLVRGAATRCFSGAWAPGSSRPARCRAAASRSPPGSRTRA